MNYNHTIDLGGEARYTDNMWRSARQDVRILHRRQLFSLQSQHPHWVYVIITDWNVKTMLSDDLLPVGLRPHLSITSTIASFLTSPRGAWALHTGRREIKKISKMATRGGFLVGDHNIRPRRPVRYLASKQTKSTKRKKKKPEWDVSTIKFTERIDNILLRIQR